MTLLDISYLDLRKWFKIRFILIPLILLSLIILLPIFIPIDSNYNPVYSIYSDNQMGKKILADQLHHDYDVKQIWQDITTYDFTNDSALVINAPQIDFTKDEIEFLHNLISTDDIPVLIFGNSQSSVKLMSAFNIINQGPSEAGRLLDFTNNFDNNPAYPKIKGMYNNTDYVSVTPSFIDTNEDISHSYLTYSTSELYTCVQTSTVNSTACEQRYMVGAIRSDIPLGVYADDFVFTNSIMNQTMVNSKLISSFLNSMGYQIDTLIFDESHYEWFPFNEKGSIMFIEHKINRTLVLTISIVLFLIIPFLLIFSGGTSTKQEFDNLSKSIRERLDYIHLERIPATPLSIEEQILVDERLEYKDRKKYYFQYVAYDLREFITEHDLDKQFSDEELFHLKQLETSLLSRKDSWRIIKHINKRLQDILSTTRRRF